MAGDDKPDQKKSSSKSGGESADRSPKSRLGVWIILGVIVLGFGFFGLPSLSVGGKDYIARVDGEKITDDDFLYQSKMVGGFFTLPDPSFQALYGVREEYLEAVVERLVLNSVADDLGMRLEPEDAEELTANGYAIVLGDTVSWLGKNPFNYEQFKNGYLPNLGVSEQNYVEVQRQELLAQAVRDLVGSSVYVPTSELRKEYEKDANTLSLKYARFKTSQYAQLVDPTPEEITAYVEGHRDDLKADLDTQGARFTKLPKQVRLAYLQVNVPPAPADDADDEAKATHKQAVADAKAKMETAQDRLAAGEDFRKVARSLSEDPVTAIDGGEYGWVSVEGTGSGLDPKVDEAALELEVGSVSDVVEGEKALYLVRVGGTREGDVPEGEALRELAEEALGKERGKDLAKQAAKEALLAIKDGKTLSDLFESDPLADPGDAPADPVKPGLRRTGAFAKGAVITGLGPVPELTDVAWTAPEDTEAFDQVFEVGEDFLIAGIESRETGSDEGFEEKRAELFERAVQAKASSVNAKWAKQLCLDAKDDGQIWQNDAKVKAALTYEGEDQDVVDQKRPYEMCDRVGSRGYMLRIGRALGGAGPGVPGQ